MNKINNDYKLIIDKAAFTLTLTEKQKDGVFKKLVEDKLYKAYKGRVYHDACSYRYNNNYQLKVVDGEYVDVSIYPYDPEHNFFRAEYNPTKLGRLGRMELRDLMIDLHSINVVKKIYYRAPITRLDLTLDVFNMAPNLFIHYDRATHSELVVKRGHIESQVVGSDRSDCRITIYDKNAERRSRGESVTEGNYQRIEMRLRNLRCTMHELTTSVNLLEKFKEISFFNGDFLQDRSFSQSFRRIASKRGLNMALGLQERNDRLCYRRYLEDYREHPISISEDDYQKACRRAFGSLDNANYREKFLSKAA